ARFPKDPGVAPPTGGGYRDCSNAANRLQPPLAASLCEERVLCAEIFLLFLSQARRRPHGAATTREREKFMSDYPRLPPRLTRIFPNNPLFFVTFCTHRRTKFLATNSVNAALVDFAVRACAEHNVAVGRYVIMPDHLHLFVCGPDDFILGRWIGAPKQALGKT